MSSVRMCDRCSAIFSERADDWSTYSGTRRKRSPEGQIVNVSDTLDACPDCTELMAPQPVQRPMPELGSSVQHHYEPESPTAAPAGS